MGHMRAKQFKFTAFDIAQAAGVLTSKVWRDIRLNRFNPYDLCEILHYVRNCK